MPDSPSLARLRAGHYNTADWNATTNPGGMGGDGHRQALVPPKAPQVAAYPVMVNDVVAVADEVKANADAAIAAAGSAATNGATVAASLANFDANIKFSASDPGAVGAGKAWFDLTDGTLKVRNTTNTAWSPAVVTLASSTPAALGAAAVGTGTTAARADHVHALPAAATTSAAGLMSASDKTKLDGVAAGATSLSLASSAPAALGTAAAGTGTTAARADHVHPLPSAATSSAAGLMSATDKAKLDGVAAGATSLSLASSAPAALGTAAAGTGTMAARADHVHPLPAVASTSTAGLMSATDKAKLDGLSSVILAQYDPAGAYNIDISSVFDDTKYYGYEIELSHLKWNGVAALEMLFYSGGAWLTSGYDWMYRHQGQTAASLTTVSSGLSPTAAISMTQSEDWSFGMCGVVKVPRITASNIQTLRWDIVAARFTGPAFTIEGVGSYGADYITPSAIRLRGSAGTRFTAGIIQVIGKRRM